MTAIGADTAWRRPLGRRQSIGLVVAWFVVALLVRLACFTGLINSDDLGYAWFARLISHSGYELNASHLGTRVGVTFPTGIAYALFGGNELTTVLLPLLASSAAVPLLVAIGRRLFNPVVGVIAGLFALTFPVDVKYASTLVPEALMQFWLLLAVLIVLAARRARHALYGLAAGVVFGLAYLTKEVTLFVAGAFVVDALLHRRWKLALGIVAGLAAVGGVETSIYAVWTGDPLHRIHVISSSQLLYFKDELDSLATPWRLFKEYPREMLIPNEDLGLHSLVALTLVVAGVRLLDREKLSMLGLWALIPMLYLNFGTVSFATYLPVPAGPRYVALVYPPLFLVAAAALERWTRTGPVARNAAVALLAGVTVVGFGCAFLTRGTGYRTVDAGALRSIARQALSANQRVVRFEGSRDRLWANSMALFVAPASPGSVPSTGCLTVSPDALGLPHASGPAPCPPDNDDMRSALPFPFR